MLTEFLQNQAALYVAGAMPEQERADFEVLIEFDGELRRCVAELAEAGEGLVRAAWGAPAVLPPPALKARLSTRIAEKARRFSPEGRVVCGSDGLMEWVNEAFTSMCGHPLADLRGKKPGKMLQGPRTDRDTVERMRQAVSEQRRCTEQIVNYHKNGDAYWVEISLAPVHDDDGRLLWFIARERELLDRPVA